MDVEELNKITKIIDAKIDEDSFLESIRNNLKHQNKHAFTNCVQEKIEQIFTEQKEIKNFLDDTSFILGGIHYISPLLGDWFRFNFPKDKLEFDILTQDLLEITYQKIPKEYNLTTWDELKFPIVYLFSKKCLPESKLCDVKKKNGVVEIQLSLKACELLYGAIFDKETNYYEYVTGESYAKNKEGNHKNIENYFDKFKGLKNILKEFKKGLAEAAPAAKKEIEEYDYDRLFRILTFSCIFTLLKVFKYNNLQIDSCKKGVIIPFRIPYYEIVEEKNPRSCFNYGGFGGLFNGDILEEKHVTNLEHVFCHLVNRLSVLENAVLKYRTSVDLVVTEDIIRLCTRLDNTKIRSLKNKYSEFLKYRIEKHTTTDSDTKKTFNAINEGIIDKRITEKFIGCNVQFVEIIERMLETIKKEYEEFQKILKKPKEEKGYCSTIFLYGEEGVGKEIIAKICHIINPRFILYKDYICQVFKENLEKGEEREKNFKKIAEMLKIEKLPGGETIPATGASNSMFNTYLSKLIKERYLFNYRNINAATLDENTFPKILFGDVKEKEEGKFGEMEIASSTGGTLFLDEIDKLDQKLANQLLKVLESPYIFQRHGEKKNRYANLLIVFASNKRLEEFAHDKFSSAFIYRIGRNYFEIPPLRMRREDIALYIWDKISSEDEKMIKSIDLRGLRLLCELPWLNNYRGLDSFIRTLFMEREIRNIDSSEISFDEIISVVRKLELLKKKSPT